MANVEIRELTPQEVTETIAGLTREVQQMPGTLHAALLLAFNLGVSHGGAFAIRHVNENIERMRRDGVEL